MPGADQSDNNYVVAYASAKPLKVCSSAHGDLLAQNIMKQANDPAAIWRFRFYCGLESEHQPDQSSPGARDAVGEVERQKLVLFAT